MPVTVKNTDNGQAVLHLDVDTALFGKHYHRICQQYARNSGIKGFRKGSVPSELIESRVGRDVLVDETISALAPRLVSEALRESDLDFVGTPQVDRFGTDEPVVLEIKVALKPHVDLVDYADLDISLDGEDDKTEDADIQTQVEKTLQDIRRSQGSWERTNEPARMGDLVTVSAEGELDGEQIVTLKKEELMMTAESTMPMVGFHAQLDGMHRGAQREFKLTIPEGYKDSDKVGKTVSFKVLLNSNSRLALPELDDKFAASLNQPNISTLDELRELISDNLQQRARADTNNMYQNKLTEQLIEKSQFQIADMLLEDEFAELDKSRKDEVAQHKLDWDEYLKKNGQTEEEYSKEVKSLAEKRLKQAIVVEALVERETPVIDDNEVSTEIANLKQNPRYAKIKRWDRVREQLISNMKKQAALESAVSKIRGTAAESDDTKQKDDKK